MRVHRRTRHTETHVPVGGRIKRAPGSKDLGLPRRHYLVSVRLGSLEDFLEKGARTWTKTPTRGDDDRDEKGIALIVTSNFRSMSIIASRILLCLQRAQNRAGTSKSARAGNGALVYSGSSAAARRSFISRRWHLRSASAYFQQH